MTRVRISCRQISCAGRAERHVPVAAEAFVSRHGIEAGRKFLFLLVLLEEWLEVPLLFAQVSVVRLDRLLVHFVALVECDSSILHLLEVR